MALLDIFKMKKLGGTVLLKDNSFLYISKVTGTRFEHNGKDMRILYEDNNGVKNEFMISQVKETRPVEHLISHIPSNDIDKGDDEYKLTRQIAVNNDHLLTESFKTEMNRILNEPYVPPETLDKKYEEFVESSPQFTNDLLTPSGFGAYGDGSFKKRKITEVPLMDDDLEKVFNRTREESYKLIESMIDEGVEKFEFSSQTVPTDVYDILVMTKGKKKSFAVLQNDNEDVFILDMNSLFIVNAIRDSSVRRANAIPNNNSPSITSVEEKSSVKDEMNYRGLSLDYPGGPWFLNKRMKLDLSSVQDIICRNDCKAIIVLGEPALYNAYLKRDLKETMIENLIKKELSNDLNILLSETEGKDVFIYVGDDTRPHTLIKIVGDYQETYGVIATEGSSVRSTSGTSGASGPVIDTPQPIIEITGNDTVKTTPLPAHLKCLAPTRYTEDLGSSTDTYFTPTKEIKIPDAPRKKENGCASHGTASSMLPFPKGTATSSEDWITFGTGYRTQDLDVFEDPSTIDINSMVTFLYKGDEKRVLVKESNDKYLEGICQEKNIYKKYLVRYIDRCSTIEEPEVSQDDDTKGSGTDIDASEDSMPYKRMVLNAIKDMYVNGTRGSSRPAIQAYIMANYKVNLTCFHDNLRRTLKRLIETGCIVQTKQKFKLGDEGRKYLKKFTKKELKPVKVNPRASNSTPQPNKIPSKTELIQYAIDNEKILDIMYDGGSISDIKRPIRPLKIFKTAYSNKQILQATCLIDDSIKNFTLDKVQIIQ